MHKPEQTVAADLAGVDLGGGKPADVWTLKRRATTNNEHGVIEAELQSRRPIFRPDTLS